MQTPVEVAGHRLPVYAVILAGGQGTRLWPLSRARRPKQFLDLKGDGQTLLQDAYRRASLAAGSGAQVLVVGLAENEPDIRQQLPGLPAENLILEPEGRNTAAGVALAALHLKQRLDEAVMLVLPADHLYLDESPWMAAVRTAIATAGETSRLVAIGIPPESPSSSYGYLRLGQPVSPSGEQAGGPEVFEVIEFVEKPEEERAKSFVQSGEYLWNTGTFAWKLSTFESALSRYLPGLNRALASLGSDIRSQEHLARAYTGLESISVDHGIMEKTSRAAVVRGNFKRIDLGTLSNLAEIWPADAQGNSGPAERLSRDSRGNIIFSDSGLVGLIGVENLVIVRSGDILLVCAKEKASEVKHLVSALSQTGLEHYR